MEHFYTSEGDAYTYEVIEKTAQITRELLGRMEPFTGSEILSIALRCRGMEGMSEHEKVAVMHKDV